MSKRLFSCGNLQLLKREIPHLLNLKLVLRWFELLSGLRVNYSKSSLVRINLPVKDVEDIAALLGCKMETPPFKYLGIPLGANPKSKKIWKPVINKDEKKLSTWKEKFLSLSARLTLIMASLSHIPIYHLSLFMVPKGIASKLESIS